MDILKNLFSTLATPTGSLQQEAPAQQKPVPVPVTEVSQQNPERAKIATALAAPVTAPTATPSQEEEVINTIQGKMLDGNFDFTNFLKLLTAKFPEANEGLLQQVLEPILNGLAATIPAQTTQAQTPAVKTETPYQLAA